MTPNTDIIISVRSTAQRPTCEYLQACVQSIRQHTHNYRLIFVDDNSDAEDAKVIEALALQHSSNLLIRTFKQNWFTRAHNLGLRFARTPWVVTINTDCVVDANWLDELYAIADELNSQGHRVGLVGSTMSMEEPRRYGITSLPSTPGNPGYVTGHCWLLNMQALYEASANRGQPGIYLDETTARAIHIFSDNEICERMNKVGWTTVASFKSLVGHHGGKSWGHDLGPVFGLRLEDVDVKYVP